MVSPSALTLRNLAIFFALTTLVVAAPTPLVSSKELSQRSNMEFNVENFAGVEARAKSTPKAPTPKPAAGSSTTPVKSQTGYETYEAFMKESDAYHAITEQDYTAKAAAANAAWQTITPYVGGAVAAVNKAAASKAASAAIPLIQAALTSSNKIATSRADALAKYGPKLAEQDQMKAKSYQGHVDQIAAQQANVKLWTDRLAQAQKIQRNNVPSVGK